MSSAIAIDQWRPCFGGMQHTCFFVGPREDFFRLPCVVLATSKNTTLYCASLSYHCGCLTDSTATSSRVKRKDLLKATVWTDAYARPHSRIDALRSDLHRIASRLITPRDGSNRRVSFGNDQRYQLRLSGPYLSRCGSNATTGSCRFTNQKHVLKSRKQNCLLSCWSVPCHCHLVLYSAVFAPCLANKATLSR